MAKAKKQELQIDSAASFVAARKRMGFTQIELALYLDITPRMVQFYESGTKKIPQKIRLAMLYLLSI